MKVGDILILKEDRKIEVGAVYTIYKKYYDRSIFYKKGQKFEIINIFDISDIQKDKFSLRIKPLDLSLDNKYLPDNPTHVVSNVNYLLTQNNYLKITRDEKLKELGIKNN